MPPGAALGEVRALPARAPQGLRHQSLPCGVGSGGEDGTDGGVPEVQGDEVGGGVKGLGAGKKK